MLEDDILITFTNNPEGEYKSCKYIHYSFHFLINRRICISRTNVHIRNTIHQLRRIVHHPSLLRVKDVRKKLIADLEFWTGTLSTLTWQGHLPIPFPILSVIRLQARLSLSKIPFLSFWVTISLVCSPPISHQCTQWSICLDSLNCSGLNWYCSMHFYEKMEATKMGLGRKMANQAHVNIPERTSLLTSNQIGGLCLKLRLLLFEYLSTYFIYLLLEVCYDVMTLPT